MHFRRGSDFVHRREYYFLYQRDDLGEWLVLIMDDIVERFNSLEPYDSDGVLVSSARANSFGLSS